MSAQTNKMCNCITCLSISKSIARCIAEKEFMFLTSTFVPSARAPSSRT